MSPFQTALIALGCVLLVADLYFTRKWIRLTRKSIELQRRTLRDMGFKDPWEDENEPPL